jgi:stress-induced morphogen
MSSMLQMYHANLAARLHPTQIGNSGNPFPIGQSPSLSAIGQFWQPHGPSAHALSNLHRSAPSAMASLLGSVQHKIQHEPVRTSSTGIGSTLTQPSPFSGPVLIGTGARNEDSCGGSSHSNSSDTNGSDTNSGDEVDVEVIDTPSCEPKKPNLSFSISNLLGNSDRDSKKSRKHIRSPTGSNNSSSGVSSGSGSSSETESGPTSGPLPVQSMPSMVKSFQNGHPAVMPHFAQFSQNLAAAHHPFRQFKAEPSTSLSHHHKHSMSPSCGSGSVQGGHTHGSEFKCEICGKCFKHVRMLNRHRRNHSPYKKYKCAYCNKGFNDSFDLKRHVRTHTGVKPYKCQYCEKSFTQRCSLESHQDKIHGIKCQMPYKKRREKIYVCEECGFSTGDVREHYKHAREAHCNSVQCNPTTHPQHHQPAASVELIKTEAGCC